MSGGIPLSSGFNVGAGIPLELKKVQPTLAARDAIPEIQRYEGLEVYVESEETYYYLKGGITNSDWEERSSGGGDSYVHPTYTNYPNGFYKITTNTLGHVTATTSVTKADITSLGIPGQDTVYTHPNHTAQTSGLYKITVDSLGHVSAVTSVVASDITALGIPAQDTTYTTITQLEITNGTVTADRLVTPKLLVDNFSKIDHTHALTATDITGILPVSKGGTGTGTAPTQYAIPYWGTTTALANSANMVWNTTYNTLSIGAGTIDNYYGLRLHRPATTTVFMKVSNTTASTGIEFGLGASGVGRIWHNNNYAISIGTNNTERINISAAGVADFKNHPTSPTATSPTTNEQLINKGFADSRYALKKAEFVSKSNEFTLVLTDAYKDLLCSGGVAFATTIPTNASVPFEIGTRINLYRTGTGVRKIIGATGVTVYGDPYIRKRYRVVQLVKQSTNIWYIIGGEE